MHDGISFGKIPIFLLGLPNEVMKRRYHLKYYCPVAAQSVFFVYSLKKWCG
jgi:hypothetical protein